MNESLLPASNTPTPHKLYWSAQITLFNKTYTPEYFYQQGEGEGVESGSESEGVGVDERGVGVGGEGERVGAGEGQREARGKGDNMDSSRDTETERGRDSVKAVVQFSNKRTARNDLAVSILKEIDISAYEEMLTGQRNVRKTLQTYRDGVISGMLRILSIRCYFSIFDARIYFICNIEIRLCLFTTSVIRIFSYISDSHR